MPLPHINLTTLHMSTQCDESVYQHCVGQPSEKDMQSQEAGRRQAIPKDKGNKVNHDEFCHDDAGIKQ